ncbi:hypothetical protein EDD86DRAFT_247941 [Gorgonomyces haynaldii]|nr:hypothetical protein EDD86DRAFT_247941 [Gorgonomyces haynaldii]
MTFSRLDELEDLFQNGIYKSAQWMLNEEQEPLTKHRLLEMVADSLARTGQEARSFRYYENCLYLNYGTPEQMIALRTKFAQVCVNVKDFFKAGQILEIIPMDQRTIQILKLLCQSRQPRCLEAVVALLDYGLGYREIEGSLNDQDIKTFAAAYFDGKKGDYEQGLQKWMSLGKKYPSSIEIARKLDMNIVESMDIYALADTLSSLSKQRPEPLAISMDSRHLVSHQVQGIFLMETKKYEDAIKAFRNAYKICRDVLTYEGLVKCYLHLNRMTDATTTYREALTTIPKAARSRALAGLVLTQISNGHEKAEEYFNQALQMDRNCIEAVYGLSQLWQNQEKLDKAIKLLESYVPYNRSEQIHIRLGNLYLQSQNYERAQRHFTSALRYKN